MKKSAALLTALLLLLGGCADTKQARLSGTGFYFDTVVTVTLYGAPQGLLEEIWQECARYERMLSRTLEGSDVDRINRANGQTVNVDAETWRILQRAKEISSLTGGAFSITIAPLSSMWDFTGGTNRIPADEERLAALPLVDDGRIQLGEGNTVTLPVGMSVDLGGIAKGYIADRIAEKICGRVSGAVLNFGGNVYVIGRKPDGSAFTVGVADPSAPESALAVIDAADVSVVTSGIYQRRFTAEGKTYHHILDPGTGLPADTDLASATVAAQSSMTADALATACIVLGKDGALRLLEENGFDGLLITREGEILTTEGFSQRYSLKTNR